MIQQGQVYSFRLELLSGVHDLSTDVLYMALYDGNANMTLQNTTEYNTTDEVTGTNYTAGGQVMTGITISQAANGSVYVNFSDVVWSAATLTCRGALIYNASKSNKAIALLDFGSDKVVSGQDFSVTMPANTSSDALIRIETNG